MPDMGCELAMRLARDEDCVRQYSQKDRITATKTARVSASDMYENAADHSSEVVNYSTAWKPMLLPWLPTIMKKSLASKHWKSEKSLFYDFWMI